MISCISTPEHLFAYDDKGPSQRNSNLTTCLILEPLEEEPLVPQLTDSHVFKEGPVKGIIWAVELDQLFQRVKAVDHDFMVLHQELGIIHRLQPLLFKEG